MALAPSQRQAVDESAFDALRASLHGDVVRPGDPDYDDARRVHNGRFDRHPIAIARVADVPDVVLAVTFASDHGLRLAVRGGGHHGAGYGTVDDGFVLDLSRMRGVRVDPVARTARVEGGATLSDVDHATHHFGLAVPGGVISTTGVAGLALGGGIGHLTRKLGLTIDNLIEADVVLASGEFVTASATSHPDLFWALRGGGGNFGVVTSFEFRLHEVGTIVGGPMLYELEDAPRVMAWYRDFIGHAPEDLGGFFAFLTVPPGPPFPEALHMKKMAGIVWCWAGDPARADEVFAPIREAFPPALDGVQPMPFPALQSAFDALYPRGARLTWRGAFVTSIPEAAIEQHVRLAPTLPSVPSTMHLYPIDGAAHRVGAGDTAFSHRDARWAMTIVGVGAEPADDAPIRAWADRYWDAVKPYVSSGAYVNFIEDEGQDRLRASYRGNLERLARVKAHYDPDNVFSLNQNIRPAG
jgi:FAD/FMN-containing dehydrogenase